MKAGRISVSDIDLEIDDKVSVLFSVRRLRQERCPMIAGLTSIWRGSVLRREHEQRGTEDRISRWSSSRTHSIRI